MTLTSHTRINVFTAALSLACTRGALNTKINNKFVINWLDVRLTLVLANSDSLFQQLNYSALTPDFFGSGRGQPNDMEGMQMCN